MKRHWWSLALSWPDDDQGMFSTAHDIFFKETKIHRFAIDSFKKKLIYIPVLYPTSMILVITVIYVKGEIDF